MEIVTKNKIGQKGTTTTWLHAKSSEFPTESCGHESRRSFSSICAFLFALSVQSLCTRSRSWVSTPAATASRWHRSDSEHSESSAPAAYSVAWLEIFRIIFTSIGTMSACATNLQVRRFSGEVVARERVVREWRRFSGEDVVSYSIKEFQILS